MGFGSYYLCEEGFILTRDMVPCLGLIYATPYQIKTDKCNMW